MTDYATLQASAADFSARTDMGAILPRLVSLAEDHIRRDVRTLDQQTESTLTVGSSGAVDLPDRFLQFRSVSLAEGTPSYERARLTYYTLDEFKESKHRVGRPTIFTIASSQLQILPAPESPSTVDIDVTYWRAYPRLDDGTNNTNWLIQNHFDVYFNGVMAQVYAYQMDPQREALWNAKYEASVLRLADHEFKKYRTGPIVKRNRRNH